MTAQKERIAWLAFVAIIAVIALRPPPRVSPTARDLDFASTLIELRQQVDGRYVRTVSDEDLCLAAIRGMFSVLDPFSEYVPPSLAEEFNLDLRGNFHGVGILVDREDEAGGLLIVRPIENSPAAGAGVRAGDRVVAVNGEDITPLPQDAIIEKIKGPLGTPVTLTLERQEGSDLRRLDLTMPRAEVASPVLDGYGRDANGQPVFWVDPEAPVKLGYIRLTRFTDQSAARTRDLITELLEQGMQGLILDLRNNPGGLLDEAIFLADDFLESGMIVSKRGEHSPEEAAYARAEGTLPHFPMVVLVNELSASASEVLAGALADHDRAVVVGTRSFGKGSVQDVIRLSDNGELKLTTAFYYLPSGRLVHKSTRDQQDWGVIPDVEVIVDYRDPEELGDISKQPPFPRQVDAATEVLLGLILAEQKGGTTATTATAPATRNRQ
jgi:carboxyl-terminal processing protease